MNMDYTKIQHIDNEGLVKYFDEADRLVKIDFLKSGNWCTIQYIEQGAYPGVRPDERVVKWSNGHAYRTWSEDCNRNFTILT